MRLAILNEKQIGAICYFGACESNDTLGAMPWVGGWVTCVQTASNQPDKSSTPATPALLIVHFDIVIFLHVEYVQYVHICTYVAYPKTDPCQ